MIKIREEINEIENRKTMEKINRTKSWFFEKINKNGKNDAITKIKSEREAIRNDLTEIRTIVKEYRWIGNFETLHKGNLSTRWLHWWIL